MNKAVALLSAVILISGCAVGPNYKKPAVSVPNGGTSSKTNNSARSSEQLFNKITICELPLRASYKHRHNSESRAPINSQP